MSDSSQVQDIIQKLRLLDCPLFCGRDDAWIKEILFKQNFDRCYLMEWIFSKLDFQVPRGDQTENSIEVKLKNLLAATSALGLCTKDDSALIEGIASQKEQVIFWSTLIDILWKKCSSYSDALGNIPEQYERQCKYISDLCNSVNINQMFKEEIQLFPPYLLKESAEACSETLPRLQSLKEIKAIALKSNISNPNWSIKNSILEKNIGFSHYTDSMLPCDRTINNLEDDVSSTLSNLHNHASEDFTETYNKLKLYLDIPPDKTTDVGPSFEAAKLKSETFLQLKDAVSMLKSSEIEQKRLNSELQSFQIPSEPLSDVLLGEYISILNEEKKDQT
ncbi:uncharacterized protein TNCT_499141 [Trichonephila clavata]|uniref:Uncharacterized protein n=1 Tax=Trichonephila clavata TaxID=2740835 RepID=A0A8X6FF57_TRICU|nr:uncharacterized protein TNCT_499141 [Trichonephila clavata]